MGEQDVVGAAHELMQAGARVVGLRVRRSTQKRAAQAYLQLSRCFAVRSDVLEFAQFETFLRDRKLLEQRSALRQRPGARAATGSLSMSDRRLRRRRRDPSDRPKHRGSGHRIPNSTPLRRAMAANQSAGDRSPARVNAVRHSTLRASASTPRGSVPGWRRRVHA